MQTCRFVRPSIWNKVLLEMSVGFMTKKGSKLKFRLQPNPESRWLRFKFTCCQNSWQSGGVGRRTPTECMHFRNL